MKEDANKLAGRERDLAIYYIRVEKERIKFESWRREKYDLQNLER